MLAAWAIDHRAPLGRSLINCSVAAGARGEPFGFASIFLFSPFVSPFCIDLGPQLPRSTAQSPQGLVANPPGSPLAGFVLLSSTFSLNFFLKPLLNLSPYLLPPFFIF
jgi:hypothetical protein